MSGTPILSIGMIVKNESRCLEQCLKALEPLRQAVPCELVIADTGSEDDTKEIASRYADILFDFPWIKDFSAARNAVMDRCSGQWFLSLDADEYLDPNIEELVTFLKSKQKAQFTSAYYIINSYSDAADKSQYSRFDAQRMLNMSTGLRFYGRIHEGWPDGSRKNNYFLRNTVFWHDGYIDFSSSAEAGKGNRNLELIELELEDDPSNLLRVYQAQESCVDQKKREYYVRRMIEMVKEGNPRSNSLGPICYRSAVQVANLYHMPELDQWIEEAYACYPASPYTQVDVRYIHLMRSMAEQDSEQTIANATAYMDALERLERDEYGAACLLTGPLLTAGKVYREVAVFALANEYIRQRNWTDCEQILRTHLPMTLSVQNVRNWCLTAFLAWEHMDLSDAFQQIGEAMFREERLEDTLMQSRKDAFFERCITVFSYIPIPEERWKNNEFFPSAPAYPLLVALGDQVLSPAAKIMLAWDYTSAADAAEQVEDWSKLPVQPVEQLLGYYLPFPPKFYEQDSGRFESLAGLVAARLQRNTVTAVLGWMRRVPENESYILDRIWRYDLLLAGLRAAEWGQEQNEELLTEYLQWFGEASERFLVWYYHPGLLQEKNVAVLPSMHRLAWFFIHYQKAAAQQQWDSAVGYLNQMIDAAPTMKKMVVYLLDGIEKKQNASAASAELQVLADQVRSILAQYKPDDPAVMALKQSPAYQKVAHLIEGMEVPICGRQLQ